MGPSVTFCFQLYSDSSLEKQLWILLVSFLPLAISSSLLICSAQLSCCLTEEPTHMQNTLKSMSEKISLNNHGLDQESQTNEIQSLLRAQWWWVHALSSIPLAASHNSSSQFLESNQLTVFPLCYGHKQWQTSLFWHRSAEPYLDPPAAPDGEGTIPPNSLYVGCKYLKICFVWVKCHGGCDFPTIASGSLAPIVHNSLWQAGSFQHLKAENRKGHLQGSDTMCA